MEPLYKHIRKDLNYKTDIDFKQSAKHEVLKNKKLMFNLFKKTRPEEKLQKKYAKLMEQAHALSTTDRKASDAKVAEAEVVLKEIEAIKNSQ